jgi:hypothetical protein
MPEPIEHDARPLSPLAGMALAMLIGGCLAATLLTSVF